MGHPASPLVLHLRPPPGPAGGATPGRLGGHGGEKGQDPGCHNGHLHRLLLPASPQRGTSVPLPPPPLSPTSSIFPLSTPPSSSFATMLCSLSPLRLVSPMTLHITPLFIAELTYMDFHTQNQGSRTCARELCFLLSMMLLLNHGSQQYLRSPGLR